MIITILILIVNNYCHNLPYQKNKGYMKGVWMFSIFQWISAVSESLVQTANSKVFPRVQIVAIYL